MLFRKLENFSGLSLPPPLSLWSPLFLSSLSDRLSPFASVMCWSSTADRLKLPGARNPVFLWHLWAHDRTFVRLLCFSAFFSRLTTVHLSWWLTGKEEEQKEKKVQTMTSSNVFCRSNASWTYWSGRCLSQSTNFHPSIQQPRYLILFHSDWTINL